MSNPLTGCISLKLSSLLRRQVLLHQDSGQVQVSICLHKQTGQNPAPSVVAQSLGTGPQHWNLCTMTCQYWIPVRHIVFLLVQDSSGTTRGPDKRAYYGVITAHLTSFQVVSTTFRKCYDEYWSEECSRMPVPSHPPHI